MNRASSRYAPNFCGNCFTIASASGSAIIRMWTVAERSVVYTFGWSPTA